MDLDRGKAGVGQGRVGSQAEGVLAELLREGGQETGTEGGRAKQESTVTL